MEFFSTDKCIDPASPSACRSAFEKAIRLDNIAAAAYHTAIRADLDEVSLLRFIVAVMAQERVCDIKAQIRSKSLAVQCTSPQPLPPEAAKALVAVDSINVQVFNVGDEDIVLEFTTNGFTHGVSWAGHLLWNSEDDDREFDEDKDEWEPFEPFFVRKIKDLIGRTASALSIKL